TALINRTRLNAWILSAAIIAAVLFLCAKKRRRLFYAAGAILEASLLFYALPAILLYPTEFVLAGQSVLSTDFLFKFTGFAAGLVLVLLVSYGIFKSVSTFSEKTSGLFLALVLIINMLNQFTSILQFLLARRIIPMIRWLFRIIVVAVNYNIVFLYVLMGIAVLIPIILFVKYAHPLLVYKNPAEKRKLRAGIRRDRRWASLVITGFVCSCFSFTVLRAYDERGVVLSPAESMTIAGEEIRIPLEQVEDGHLHRFAWNASDGTEVRFIVIRKSTAAYGVGLDACDICGNTGYYERRDEVICRLCDVVMNKSTIGFKGGCNPVPLAYSVRDGAMLVLLEDLEKEKGRFK
ncbi:MAG: Fe-S-containing protein, partial [Treponema sp.]|nr:Fe-S-containing protein [Treponema sp.]